MIEPREPPTEPDRVSGRMIALGAAAAFVAVIASGVLVWLLAGARLRGGGEHPGTHLPAELDAIDTPPFALPLDAERVRDAQRARLDRRLDGAIDRYLASHAAPAPAGGAR